MGPGRLPQPGDEVFGVRRRERVRVGRAAEQQVTRETLRSGGEQQAAEEGVAISGWNQKRPSTVSSRLSHLRYGWGVPRHR